MTALDVSVDGPVAQLTMNRAEKLNALNLDMRLELIDTLRKLNSSRDIRTVVLTGRGRAFCVGADIESISADLSDDLRKTFHPILREIIFGPKIFISAVDGVAAGAGISLAVACDIRYCSPGSKFVTAFHRIGLAPDTGLTYMLTRLAPASAVGELMLRGGEFTGEKAGEWNLFRLSDNPVPAALSAARDISAGPSLSYSASKELLNRSLFGDIDDYLSLEAELQGKLGRSLDFAEGVSAFREKRKPSFSGK